MNKRSYKSRKRMMTVLTLFLFLQAPAVHATQAEEVQVPSASIQYTQIADGGTYRELEAPEIQISGMTHVKAELTQTDADGTVTDWSWKVPKATKDDSGISFVLDIFQEAPDGIYQLTVNGTDAAGDKVQTHLTFSLNKNGSIYQKDETLTAIHGTYIQAVETDLTLTERNPSGTLTGTERVCITHNGKLIANPEYIIESASRNAGWYETHYRISRNNFKEDGIYKIMVSAEDQAGNLNENTEADNAIWFVVDTTAPELTNITGLEEQNPIFDSITVKAAASDNLELATITVYADNTQIFHKEDIDETDTEISFKLEKGEDQHIRIVITDKVGNELDTDSEGFTPGYPFPETVTVNANAGIRFYAKQALIIFGCVVLSILLLLVC